jgi:hypothetical protein
MGLVLLSWIRMRRRFRLAEPGAQVAMILGTWLLAAADVTVFAFAIR